MWEVLAGLLGIMIGIAVIAALIGTFFMWIGAELAKVKKVTFWKALSAAVVCSLVTWIVSWIFAGFSSGIATILGFLLGLFLTLFIIKSIFKIDWGKAVLVWLFQILAEVITVIVAIMTFAGIILTLIKI